MKDIEESLEFIAVVTVLAVVSVVVGVVTTLAIYIQI